MAFASAPANLSPGRRRRLYWTNLLEPFPLNHQAETVMSESNSQHSEGASRRTFLKTTSALVGGAVLGANATIARSAHIGGSDEIKVALIGCGGRGTGAATQALATKGKVTLWAAADAFASNLKAGLNSIKEQVKRGKHDGDELFNDSTVNVPPERQFVGLDAYQKAIDSGADVVILATPPGFRPIHFEAAVKAGRQIFAEKPIAVDGPGVRRFMAANEEAKKKDLMVAIGLQRRHDPRYIETMKKIHDGALGDILFTRVYWNSGGLWVRTHADFAAAHGHKPTEMEYQVNNWYYFPWLCGDHIVEQHIHNLDIGNWIKGDKHPVEAQGMGGRQVRTGKEYGQIFDHHFVEYTYADGIEDVQPVPPSRRLRRRMSRACPRHEGHARYRRRRDRRRDEVRGRQKVALQRQEGRQPSPGAPRFVRGAPRRSHLQRRRLRRTIDHDGNPRPHGDLLRQDHQVGRSAEDGHRPVARIVRLRGDAARLAG